MSKNVKLGLKLPVVFSIKKKRVVIGENPNNRSGLMYSLVMDDSSIKSCYKSFKKQIPTCGGVLVVMGYSKKLRPIVLGIVRSSDNLRESFEMCMASDRLKWLLLKLEGQDLDGIYLQLAQAS